jgi:hypothetical protein
MASVAMVTAVSKPKVTWVGHTDDLEALFLHQPIGDAQGTVAADGDESVGADLLDVGHDLVGTIHQGRGAIFLFNWPVEGVAAVDRAQDGAAEVGDAAHGAWCQVDQPIGEAVHEPVVAAADAGDLPAAGVGGQDRRADDGVQTGRVAAAGVHQQMHGSSSRPDVRACLATMQR